MELYLCSQISCHRDAYALLAYAAHRRWGLDSLPDISRNAHGKPYFPSLPQYHFNLSHSDSFALCALDEQPVGADIEALRPHHPKLAQRICSEQELAWLETQQDKTVALCQLWTGKESLAKYLGTGLTVPLRSLCPPLPPADRQDGLLFYRALTPEYCLCVCGHTAVSAIFSVNTEEISP